MEELIENEKHLTGDEDPEMIEAGSERLSIFKEMNILIPLSKDYGMTIEQIASWTYSTVFVFMYYAKITSEFEQEQHNIIDKKFNK